MNFQSFFQPTSFFVSRAAIGSMALLLPMLLQAAEVHLIKEKDQPCLPTASEKTINLSKHTINKKKLKEYFLPESDFQKIILNECNIGSYKKLVDRISKYKNLEVIELKDTEITEKDLDILITVLKGIVDDKSDEKAITIYLNKQCTEQVFDKRKYILESITISKRDVKSIQRYKDNSTLERIKNRTVINSGPNSPTGNQRETVNQPPVPNNINISRKKSFIMSKITK